MESVFAAVIEEKGDYEHVLVSTTLDKNELPMTNDIIEFYPEVVGRVVIKRKLFYVKGKLEEVRLYV